MDDVLVNIQLPGRCNVSHSQQYKDLIQAIPYKCALKCHIIVIPVARVYWKSVHYIIYPIQFVFANK